MTNDGDRALLEARPELLEFEGTGVREGRTHVAVVDDRVVGFASIVVSASSLELEDLFVDPDWMRQGVGRALVAAVAVAVRDTGQSTIEVDANHHALAFYREVGFLDLGEVPIEYGTATRMRLDVAVR